MKRPPQARMLRFTACAELRISEPTYRRWTVEGVVRSISGLEVPLSYAAQQTV